jgi:hypothetical protein
MQIRKQGVGVTAIALLPLAFKSQTTMRRLDAAIQWNGRLQLDARSGSD